MTGPADALAPVTDLVGHLRWHLGPPADGPPPLRGAALAADPDALAAEVAATGPGRGSQDPQVLASLWWQAYAYRVGGTVLAAWVLTGTAPDPSAPGTGVTVGRSRPDGLVVDPAAAVVTDLDDLLARLFAGHLDPLAAALRARHPLGARLLWGDVAAGVASALGAVGSAPDAPDLGPGVQNLTLRLPHGIGGLGAWTAGTWSFRRTTCCLWWKTTVADGRLCSDCSLPTPPPSKDALR